MTVPDFSQRTPTLEGRWGTTGATITVDWTTNGEYTEQSGLTLAARRASNDPSVFSGIAATEQRSSVLTSRSNRARFSFLDTTIPVSTFGNLFVFAYRRVNTNGSIEYGEWWEGRIGQRPTATVSVPTKVTFLNVDDVKQGARNVQKVMVLVEGGGADTFTYEWYVNGVTINPSTTYVQRNNPIFEWLPGSETVQKNLAFYSVRMYAKGDGINYVLNGPGNLPNEIFNSWNAATQKDSRAKRFTAFLNRARNPTVPTVNLLGVQDVDKDDSLRIYTTMTGGLYDKRSLSERVQNKTGSIQVLPAGAGTVTVAEPSNYLDLAYDFTPSDSLTEDTDVTITFNWLFYGTGDFVRNNRSQLGSATARFRVTGHLGPAVPPTALTYSLPAEIDARVGGTLQITGLTGGTYDTITQIRYNIRLVDGTLIQSSKTIAGPIQLPVTLTVDPYPQLADDDEIYLTINITVAGTGTNAKSGTNIRKVFSTPEITFRGLPDVTAGAFDRWSYTLPQHVAPGSSFALPAPVLTGGMYDVVKYEWVLTSSTYQVLDENNEAETITAVIPIEQLADAISLITIAQPTFTAPTEWKKAEHANVIADLDMDLYVKLSFEGDGTSYRNGSAATAFTQTLTVKVYDPRPQVVMPRISLSGVRDIRENSSTQLTLNFSGTSYDQIIYKWEVSLPDDTYLTVNENGQDMRYDPMVDQAYRTVKLHANSVSRTKSVTVTCTVTVTGFNQLGDWRGMASGKVSGVIQILDITDAEAPELVISYDDIAIPGGSLVFRNGEVTLRMQERARAAFNSILIQGTGTYDRIDSYAWKAIPSSLGTFNNASARDVLFTARSVAGSAAPELGFIQCTITVSYTNDQGDTSQVADTVTQPIGIFPLPEATTPIAHIAFFPEVAEEQEAVIARLFIEKEGKHDNLTYSWDYEPTLAGDQMFNGNLDFFTIIPGEIIDEQDRLITVVRCEVTATGDDTTTDKDSTATTTFSSAPLLVRFKRSQALAPTVDLSQTVTGQLLEGQEMVLTVQLYGGKYDLVRSYQWTVDPPEAGAIHVPTDGSTATFTAAVQDQDMVARIKVVVTVGGDDTTVVDGQSVKEFAETEPFRIISSALDVMDANTSRLEAVNYLLRVLQESPVNDLSGGFGVDAQAEAALDYAARELFIEAHPFSAEQIEVVPDENGHITFGNDVLSVKVMTANGADWQPDRYVLRGNGLYDRHEKALGRGWQYPESAQFEVQITRFMPWDEMPEHARQVVLATAARDLSREQVNDSEDASDLDRRWFEARAEFESIEAGASSTNVFEAAPRMMDPRNFLGRSAWL